MTKQTEAANFPTRPLKRLRLIGPDTEVVGDVYEYDDAFKACLDCLLMRRITRESLEGIMDRVDEYTNIEIIAHGTADKGEHSITLIEGIKKRLKF